jgi:hypothetical protein
MRNASEGYSPKAAQLVAAIVTPATLDNDLGELRFPRATGTGQYSLCWLNKCKELTMAPRRKPPAKRRGRKSTPKRWSQRVTRESDALDLKRGVFKLISAKKIAASLKRSAEQSTRRKSGAYRSALSMLIFYINRAGKNLPQAQRNRLERAKLELKHQFGRE